MSIRIKIDKLFQVGMMLNTFKYSSVVGVLALAALGCADQVTQPVPQTLRKIEPISAGQIVFFDETAHGIYVADANGQRLRRISQPGTLDRDPAVSRDGSRIAYSNTVANGNGSNIYVMNADGTSPVNVTGLPGNNDRPAWSPDGKRIAFESTSGGGYTRVFVVNADGTGLTALTPSAGNNGAPEWSPDGTRIVFFRDQLGFESKGIFSMDPDGTHVTQLTSGIVDREPTWSPDGNRVAFVRRGLNEHGELFVVNADGSDLKQVTSGIRTVSDPSWSPDGKSIAFGFVSDFLMCPDFEYGNGEEYPCGYDVERVSLDGVIDPLWVLRSASNIVWQR